MPDTFTLRSATVDDAEAVTDLVNVCSQLEVGRDMEDTEMIAQWMSDPDVPIDLRWRVAVDDAGAIVGSAAVQGITPFANMWAHGFVHPDARERGIGTALLAWTTGAARALAEAAPAHADPRLRLWHWESNPTAASLFIAHGYVLVRDFYTMRMDVPGDFREPPPTPEAISIRPIDLPRDAAAAYAVDIESFADHFAPNTPSLEQWTRWHLEAPDADPSLFFVAEEGGRLIGHCVAVVHLAEPDTGVISDLSVIPAARGRGLGSALLSTGLRALAERGVARVILDVDAENRYNAVALYERAGMRVQDRSPVYERSLR